MAYLKNKYLANIKKWNIDLSKYKDVVYYGYIYAPKDLKEFTGFKELFGFEIKEVRGDLTFDSCTSLTWVSNLPEYVGHNLSFYNCYSLTSVSNLPEYVGGELAFFKCLNLKNISNFPKIFTKSIILSHCESLVSIPDMPESLKVFRCNFLPKLTHISNFSSKMVDFYIMFCDELKELSNIPLHVKGNIVITFCENLTSVSNMPSFVGNTIYTEGTTFFQKMNEEEIREKYDICRTDSNFKKWGVDINFLNDGTYIDGIIAPYDILEFKGFEEELGININKLEGSLNFGPRELPYKLEILDAINHSYKIYTSHSDGCTSLTSVSNLPEKINGSLIFSHCTYLTSISNLPDYVGGYFSFGRCISLTSISKMPSVVKGFIYTEDCPFFEGMDEAQVRKKYGIRKE